MITIDFPLILKNTRSKQFEVYFSNGYMWLLTENSVSFTDHNREFLTFENYINHLYGLKNSNLFEVMKEDDYEFELFKFLNTFLGIQKQATKAQDDKTYFQYFCKSLKEQEFNNKMTNW